MKKTACILSFVPAVIWMALIYSFSAAPAVESSETSDGISYKIVKVMAGLPFLDWEEDDPQSSTFQRIRVVSRIVGGAPRLYDKGQ